MRELEDHQFAPRFQHAIHLIKTLFEIREVPHAIRTRQQVKRSIRIGHLQRATFRKRYRILHALIRSFLLPYTHHLRTKVDTFHMASLASSYELNSQIARADSYIERLCMGRENTPYRLPAPAFIYTQRGGVIERIVMRSNMIKQ